MKPPMCSYCGARFSPFKTEGTTLQFALSPEDEAANQRFIESRRKGHLRGLHWICGDHIEAARELTHLKWAEASAQMRADGVER